MHIPTFIYEALDTAGKKVKGEISRDSRYEVLTTLRSNALSPVEILEKKLGAMDNWASKDLFKPTIKKKHIAIFVRQFASMLQAGIPLPILMDVLITQEKNKHFKEILISINNDILAGNTLSSALSRYKVFPPFLTSMVEVGEVNGRLDTAFDRVAISLEKDMKLTSKIKGAMIYPIVLFSVSILVSILLSFVVLPIFSGMFEQFGVELPTTTRIFMTLSGLMRGYWYVLVGVIAVSAGIIVKLLREPTLKAKLDQFLLSIPLIGRVQNTLAMARFCRIFSTLVEGGVDIIVSLETVKKVLSNQYIKNCFDDIIKQVRTGSTLSTSISHHSLFTPLVVSMVRIGEESGRLGEVLSRTAEFYEDDSDTQLQQLTAMAEPAVTLMMALGIGFIVISIVQPMFKMYTVIGK